MKNYMPETSYIHSDPILAAIYVRAVNKFMASAGKSIVFFDLAEYIEKQLVWRKQSVYKHGFPILREVCDRIGEDFNAGCEFAAPNANCFRDVYFEVFS